jgi:hypothetical protein
MQPEFTVTLPTGRASFKGLKRDWDEQPRKAFSVELRGEKPLYGIWRSKFSANENDFNVEVVSFGWVDINSIGCPDQSTRIKLTPEQFDEVTTLIVAMFSDLNIRKHIVPFSINTARFLGRIEFDDNWALMID